MKIIIQRDKPLEKVVFAKLILDWTKIQPDIYTIVPYPAIPAGIYPLLGHNTDAHPDTWEVGNVPGHTGILIHDGNFACDVTWNGVFRKSDSKNCILPGFGVNEDIPMVLNSKKCIEYLRVMLGVKANGVPMNIDVDIRDA